MPAPFDFAYIIVIHNEFINVDPIVAGFATLWRLAPWSFSAIEDAKTKINEFYKIKEWLPRPDDIIWSYAVVYAGYDTEDVPYPFGAKVTLAIIPKEMIF